MHGETVKYIEGLSLPDKKHPVLWNVYSLQTKTLAGITMRNKSTRAYENIWIYYSRYKPTCFGHLLWPSSGR